MNDVPASLRAAMGATVHETNVAPLPSVAAVLPQSQPSPVAPPSPVLRVCIDAHRLAPYQQADPHIEYRIKCVFGSGRWHTWRRFREFVALREALQPRVRSASYALPHKGFSKHATSDATSAERAAALTIWLGRVVSDEAAVASPVLLAFIGLATLEPTGRGRPRMHVKLLDAPGAESGDLILFRTRAAVPALQRAVTGSTWDHVGILVFRDALHRVCRAADRGPAGEVGIVEADSSGTRFYSLGGYKVSWHTQYEEMALRPLEWPGRGTDAAIATLNAWLDTVLGRPYELTIGKITVGTHSKLVSSTCSGSGGGSGGGSCSGGGSGGSRSEVGCGVESRFDTTSGGDDNCNGSERASKANCELPKGFFCSELAAHAYKALGVLPAERPACGYWPVDFGEAACGQLPLMAGASLGPELPIDWHTPGVDTISPEAAAAKLRFERTSERGAADDDDSEVDSDWVEESSASELGDS